MYVISKGRILWHGKFKKTYYTNWRIQGYWGTNFYRQSPTIDFNSLRSSYNKIDIAHFFDSFDRKLERGNI